MRLTEGDIPSLKDMHFTINLSSVFSCIIPRDSRYFTLTVTFTVLCPELYDPFPEAAIVTRTL